MPGQAVYERERREMGNGQGEREREAGGIGIKRFKGGLDRRK